MSAPIAMADSPPPAPLFVSRRPWLGGLLGLLALAAIFAVGWYDYLLFHVLAELFSVVVAVGIFIIAWNCRDLMPNGYLLFLGIGYLFVGLLDLAHMLVYEGMGIFPGLGANPATQIWLAARFFEAVALLLGPLFIRHRLYPRLTLGLYTALTALVLLSVARWDVIPVAYSDRLGRLTEFKVVSEYVICGILVLAAAYLFRVRAALDRRVFGLLMASIAATILAELSFTLYHSPYGTYNKLGHVLKLASFFFIYQAVISTGLRQPTRLLFHELTQSEQAYRRSEERFRLAVRSSPVSLYQTDAGLRVTWIRNPHPDLAEDLLAGRRFDQVSGRPELAGLAELTRRVFESDASERMELGIDLSDGHHIYDLTAVPLHDAAERAVGVTLAAVDITERRRIEQELLRLSEELRRRAEDDLEKEKASVESALSTMRDVFFILDPGRRLVRWNPALPAASGRTDEELAGADPLELVAPADRDRLAAAFTEVAERRALSLDVHLQAPAGRSIPFDLTVNAIIDREERFLGISGIARDVTEKLRLESIAQAVNTMNNIGYVFSGIRHEIGNPINSLNMTLKNLKTNLPKLEQEAVERYLDRGLEALARVVDLLHDLKNFNMYEHMQIQPVEVRRLVDNFVALARNDSLEKGIAIEPRIADGVGVCLADPRALQQVLLNLLTNAADACQGVEDPAIRVEAERRGEMVRIAVADNGRGMDAEQRDGLFKPFFTTKLHGTGLGMVIVHKMISQMNGTIEVDSEPGKGTRISLLLPAGPPG